MKHTLITLNKSQPYYAARAIVATGKPLRAYKNGRYMYVPAQELIKQGSTTAGGGDYPFKSSEYDVLLTTL